jgi:2-oxoglutarate ferredoxin oxidoreductase subunit alpha
MAEREVMCETMQMENAEIAVVAFGTSARIAKTAVNLARAKGIKAGLIRPITLFPFPEKIIAKAAESVKRFLVVEMNMGQMVEDVKLAVNGKAEVSFYGRPGGAILTVEDIMIAMQHAAPAETGRKKMHATAE